MPQAKKADSADKKKPARQNARPRLDAVIRHIKAGSYDEDMATLTGAIEDRQRVRQEAVLGLVKETFGDGYVVAPKIQRSAPGVVQRGEHESQEEWEAAERRAKEQEKALARDPLGSDEDDLGPDHESHSPIIGSIPDKPVVGADPGIEVGDTTHTAPEADEPKPNPFLDLDKK